MRTNALHSTVLGYVLMEFSPSLRTLLSSLVKTRHHDWVVTCVPNVQTVMDTVGRLFLASFRQLRVIFFDRFIFIPSFIRKDFFFFFLNQAGFLLQAEEIFTLLDFREHMDTKMTNSAEFSLSGLRTEG